MPEQIFMKLCMYIMLSETMSTVYLIITQISNTNTTAPQIVLFY
jgi:hypothetical protein